jgi:glycosyltransferase involved in cell wall biosynthesis/ubiquinone/menaquinone biosynthesis C-methylase UbiE
MDDRGGDCRGDPDGDRMPAVSVIMPSYQHARFLPEAIESVLAQTFTDLELIIIDDRSTDGSQEIIRRYAVRDPRVVMAFHTVNHGIPRTVNDGLSRATGTYVAFIASDDIWAPEKLAMQYQVLLNDPDLVVWSEAELINEAGEPMNMAFSESCPVVTRRYSGNIFRDLLWGNYVLASTMMLSRDAACEVGFCEDLRYLNDYRFIVDLSYRHKFLWIGVPLVQYRVHSGGTLYASSYGHSQDLAALSRYFMRRYGHELPNNLRWFLRFQGSAGYRSFLRANLRVSTFLFPTGSRRRDIYARTIPACKHLIQGNAPKCLHTFRYDHSSVDTSTPNLLRAKDDIPPDDADHTPASQYRIWENRDWTSYGEERNASEDWKMSVVDEIMYRNITPGGTILEVGPGAGRWSEYLQKIARHLILVDISDRCISICRERFIACQNISYHTTSGSNLEFIPDESVDFIWSFDVFVVINPTDIDNYIREFARILKPGGKAVIHHAHDFKNAVNRAHDRRHERSMMTAGHFAGIIRRYGLTLIKQFDSWGDGYHNVRCYRDIISVFEKSPDIPLRSEVFLHTITAGNPDPDLLKPL